MKIAQVVLEEQLFRKTLRFLCLVYYVFSLSFHLCMSPTTSSVDKYYENQSLLTTIVDYGVDLLFVLDWVFWYFIPKSVKPTDYNIHQARSTASEETEITIKKGKYYKFQRIREVCWQIFLVFPFEALGFAGGMRNYQWLRLTRLARFYYFHVYWDDIRDLLETHKILTSTVLQRVLFLTVIMALVGHVGACLWYALALDLMRKGAPRTWLSGDNLVTRDDITGLISEHYSISYRYLRSLYWSVQTLDTVGFGDIVAYTQEETWFCIFFFYLSAFLIYISIANLVMFVTKSDSARTENLRKVAKFDKYAAYRKLPLELTRKVRSFYAYQWQLLKGVDESQILSELPLNISQQVVQHLVRDLLTNIDTLRSLNKGILNTLSENVETYIYSPGDIIIDNDMTVAGVYVISTGYVEVLNMTHVLTNLLVDGQVFGAKALEKPYFSAEMYRAKSFAEVIYLRTTVYQTICQNNSTAMDESASESALTPLQQSSGRNASQVEPGDPVPKKTILGIGMPARMSARVRLKSIHVMRHSFLQFAQNIPHTSNHFWQRQCRPDSAFRLLWDFFLFWCVVFYVTSIALLLAGTVRQQYIEHYYGLLVTSYVVDAVFFVDLVLRLSVYAYEEKGIVITKSSKICKHYITTHNLLVVALSILPIDIILGVAVSHKLIPVLRLLKLLHVRGMQRYLKCCEEVFRLYLNIRLTFEMNRFIGLYSLLFLLCHWVGCIWQLSADVSTAYFGYSINWRQADRHSAYVSQDYQSLSHTVSYFRGIYWAAGVMSSIGFNDIVETNSIETIVIIVVMFFGYLLFNTLLGALASLMSNFNREKREFSAKVEKVKQLMVYKAIPADLQTRILRYYEYVWTRYSGVNESEVLNSLPKSLRADVANYVMSPLISNIPFFASCSEKMIQFIVTLLQTRIFLNDDIIVTCGEIGKEMFIIEKGSVKVTSADREVVYTTLSEGAYIGESCLLEVGRRTASAFAVGYVDTYFLSAEDFDQAADSFPEEYARVLSAIDATLQKKRDMNRQTLLVSATQQSHQTIKTAASERLSLTSAKQNTTTGTTSAGGTITTTTAGMLPTIEQNENEISNHENSHDNDNSSSNNSNSNSIGNSFTNVCYRMSQSIRHTINNSTTLTNTGIVFTYIYSSIASTDSMKPQSTFKLGWDVLIFTTLVYYAIVIPLRIALQLNPYGYAIDYLCDLINLLDNYWHFSRFSVQRGGQLLTEKRDIKHHYLHHYRLYLDIVTSMPYDLFALCYIGDRKRLIYITLALLRLPKLCKLLIAHKYYAQVERLSKYLKVNFLIYRFFELTMLLLLIAHWVACAFFLFGDYSGPKDSCKVHPTASGEVSCHFRRTWVEQQILTSKLPLDGGDQWSRFIRAYNWALPTLTSESVGDIHGMNAKETVFAFFTMFCGLSVNGAIIGSIMTLVSDANVQVTEIHRRMELLQAHLTTHNVPVALVVSSTALLRHLASEEGALTSQQDVIFSELPHSLKVAVDDCLKTVPYLRRCAFFDFCNDEVLRGISAKLHLKIYTKGDKIITHGDLGHEMFFLESGSVSVVSGDGQTLYATLEEGAFFGETGLFFKTPRVATIQVSSPFCVCLQLSKADLDRELRACAYNDAEVFESFRALQVTNMNRNKAVTDNIRIANSHMESKLHKLIQIENNNVTTQHSVLVQLRYALSPDSYFRILWDILGFICLVYYTLSIPLYIAFFFGEKVELYLRYIAFDFLIDSYWVIDILLKLYVFSFKSDLTSDKLVVDREAIYMRYRNSGYMFTDFIASVPFELIGLLPNMPPIVIFICRATHLLRVSQFFNYCVLVENHIRTQLNVRIGRATSMLIRAAFSYIVLNHWLTCMYFMIHRYSEHNSSLTYVIADGHATYNDNTGTHDICNTAVSFCYARSFYFVLGTLTSVGYGDISPYTNKEFMFQQLVATLGAYMAAAFVGFSENYWEELDANGDTALKQKIKDLKHYIAFRKLGPSLKSAIITQYKHMWSKCKSVSGDHNHMLDLLSDACAMEISLHLNKSVVSHVPILRDVSYQVKRRLANVLRPQLALKQSHLYYAGDLGHSIFFVASGQVTVQLSSDRSLLDIHGIYTLQALMNKQIKCGMQHNVGTHFGEYCVLSSSGLRVDTAIATADTEVYTLRKYDLWDIFQFMTVADQRAFLLQLFTRVGDEYHVEIQPNEMGALTSGEANVGDQQNDNRNNRSYSYSDSSDNNDSKNDNNNDTSDALETTDQQGDVIQCMYDLACEVCCEVNGRISNADIVATTTITRSDSDRNNSNNSNRKDDNSSNINSNSLWDIDNNEILADKFSRHTPKSSPLSPVFPSRGTSPKQNNRNSINRNSNNSSNSDGNNSSNSNSISSSNSTDSNVQAIQSILRDTAFIETLRAKHQQQTMLLHNSDINSSHNYNNTSSSSNSNTNNMINTINSVHNTHKAVALARNNKSFNADTLSARIMRRNSLDLDEEIREGQGRNSDLYAQGVQSSPFSQRRRSDLYGSSSSTKSGKQSVPVFGTSNSNSGDSTKESDHTSRHEQMDGQGGSDEVYGFETVYGIENSVLTQAIKAKARRMSQVQFARRDSSKVPVVVSTEPIAADCQQHTIEDSAAQMTENRADRTTTNSCMHMEDLEAGEAAGEIESVVENPSPSQQYQQYHQQQQQPPQQQQYQLIHNAGKDDVLSQSGSEDLSALMESYSFELSSDGSVFSDKDE